MIIIKITNADEIVKNHRNWFISRLAPYFMDVETRVEKAVAEQIKQIFAEKNIQAKITIVPENEKPV